VRACTGINVPVNAATSASSWSTGTSCTLKFNIFSAAAVRHAWCNGCLLQRLTGSRWLVVVYRHATHIQCTHTDSDTSMANTSASYVGPLVSHTAVWRSFALTMTTTFSPACQCQVVQRRTQWTHHTDTILRCDRPITNDLHRKMHGGFTGLTCHFNLTLKPNVRKTVTSRTEMRGMEMQSNAM